MLGVGSVRQAAKVGHVGGLALGYFLAMSTAALAIGLVVGNLLHPGSQLHLTESLRGAAAKTATGEPKGTVDFVLGIIPSTLVSPLTSGEVLQALLVALLVGFAVQGMGASGIPILRTISYFQRLVSHRPDLVDGVGFIVGIDRFMSEARALTNFAGNAVATVLIGAWTRELDKARAEQVLSGSLPFDEHHHEAIEAHGHAPVAEAELRAR